MENHKSTLRLYFTVFTFALKVLGFNVFKYPSSSLKFSFLGIIFFVLCLFCTSVHCVTTFFSSFRYDGQDVSAAVERTDKILSYSVIVSIVSTDIARISILIINFGLCRKIFHVIQDVEDLDSEVRLYSLINIK